MIHKFVSVFFLPLHLVSIPDTIIEHNITARNTAHQLVTVVSSNCKSFIKQSLALVWMPVDILEQ